MNWVVVGSVWGGICSGMGLQVLWNTQQYFLLAGVEMRICTYEGSCLLDLSVFLWIFDVGSDNTSFLQGCKGGAGRCMVCDTTINLKHATNVAKEVLNKLERYLHAVSTQKWRNLRDSLIFITLLVLNASQKYIWMCSMALVWHMHSMCISELNQNYNHRKTQSDLYKEHCKS